MGNWFGDLQLAYKYTIVFLSLLFLTILAGVIKVIYDRRRLKKIVKAQANTEAGPADDQMELNQREKDEGDLFGVRAIEAGFYAGIPQSRPTSRAGSYIDSPSMSSHTLIGTSNSLKAQGYSMNSSVTSLPLAHASERSRDSETLPSNSPPRRKSPPTIRLAPSEAQLSGRHNYNAAVNMSLNVPPSPVLARGPSSPTFGGSDSGESDGQGSPRSQNFSRPEHYAPVPPHIPMPEGLRASVHSAEDYRSQAGSFNDPSPGHSAPSSPGHAPDSRLPSLPAKALRDDPRSLSPYSDRRNSPPRSASPGSRSPQPNPESERPSSPIRLQPQTYQPQSAHQRDTSDASSVYSNANRMSTHHRNRTGSTDFSFNYSLPQNASRNSAFLAASSQDPSQRHSTSVNLNVPSSSQGNQQQDPRLSEFYDAYYRQSQLGLPTKEAAKRPTQLNLAQSTITEVDSPMPSPNPQSGVQHPGVAM